MKPKPRLQIKFFRGSTWVRNNEQPEPQDLRIGTRESTESPCTPSQALSAEIEPQGKRLTGQRKRLRTNAARKQGHLSKG